MKEINVNDIDKISDAFIIDVREDEEVFETGTIKGAVHLPMMTVPNSLNKIPKRQRNLYPLQKWQKIL